MLFRTAILAKIERGDVTLAFRRWTRPTVKPGGRLRTAIGELAIDTVERCEPDDIGDGEARAAGFPDRDALFADLRSEGDLYRIGFRFAGADPRIALRAQNRLSADELEPIRRRLARLDAGGEWTIAVLRFLAGHEGTAAGDIAAAFATDKLVLKRNIRKLKDLGLTESLAIGYRLSPRGAAVLAALDSPVM